MKQDIFFSVSSRKRSLLVGHIFEQLVDREFLPLRFKQILSSDN